MSRSKLRSPIVLFLLLTLGAILVQVTYAVVLLGKVSVEDAGLLGDLFGAINALFSGLALAGVIVAIVLQKKELEHQREELQLNREELAGQRRTLEDQYALNRLQMFETSFYSMLRFLRDAANTVRCRVPDSGGEHVGIGAFRAASEAVRNEARMTVLGDRPDGQLTIIRLAYDRNCSTSASDFGPYFRSLAEIMRFVDSQDAPQPNRYAMLVRAQLSSQELAVLFACALTPLGQETLKSMVERHAFFEGWAVPIEYEQYVRFYSPTAFGPGGEPK